MGMVTILKSDCAMIVEDEFVKWLDSKDKLWWTQYGLCWTGEDDEQDDESDVRSFIPEIIDEFNTTQTMQNGGDIGCKNALIDMVGEYLKNKCGASSEHFFEVYSDTNVTILRK